MDGVTHRLALGGGTGRGGREAQHASAKAQHGGLKGKAGTGGRLEEEGGQLLVGAGILVLHGVFDDILRNGDELFDLFCGKVNNVDQVSCHLLRLLFLFKGWKAFATTGSFRCPL